MTREDIIKMAQEAGWQDLRDLDSEIVDDIFVGSLSTIERLINMAQAAEREACARMVEDLNDIGHSYGLENRIRARGNNE